jgi:hypothetical protein
MAATLSFHAPEGIEMDQEDKKRTQNDLHIAFMLEQISFPIKFFYFCLLLLFNPRQEPARWK